MLFRSTVPASALLSFLLLAATAHGDWPQWRGADASGISSEVDLPTLWSEDADNILWSAELPGHGLSSPIVCDDQIYVTTAYETTESRFWVDAFASLLAAAATFGCLGVSLRERIAPVDEEAVLAPPGGDLPGRFLAASARLLLAVAMGAGLTADFAWMEQHWFGVQPRIAMLAALAVVGASAFVRRWFQSPSRRPLDMAVVVAAVASTAWFLYDFQPRYSFVTGMLSLYLAAELLIDRRTIEAGRLGRLAAVLDATFVRCALFAALGLVVSAALRPTLFWTQSPPQHIWERSAVIVGVGAIAAVGLLRPHSWTRLLGAGLLIVVALLLWRCEPLPFRASTRWNERTLISIAPGLVAACWYLMAYLILRRQAATSFRVLRACCAVALALAVGFVFFRANFMQSSLVMRHVVLCFDFRNGELLWEKPVHDCPPGKLLHTISSHATPTPCTDGRFVVAHFGPCTACLDVDGRLLWTHEAPDFLPTVLFGAGSSPIIVGDTAIVFQEREREHELRPSRFAAFDLESGDLRWCIEPEHLHGSYGTPLARPRRDGAVQLLWTSWDALLAFDLEEGEELWSCEINAREVCTSLIASEECVYFSGGSIRGAGVTAAIRDVESAERGRPPEIVWSTRREVASCASPLLYGAALYVIAENGVLSRFDARTGERLGRIRLPGQFYASPVAGDGKLYFTSEDGITTVFAAGAALEPLATNDLDEQIFASPAIADGRLLFRTENRLVCIGPDA